MPGGMSPNPNAACPYCGLIHATTCSRIRRIEYAEDGVTVRALEFHPPAPTLFPDPPKLSARELWGPGSGPLSNE